MNAYTEHASKQSRRSRLQQVRDTGAAHGVKHIVITGATSGIGEQLARDYLSQGHVVYALGRSEAKLAQLAKLGMHTAQIDVTNRDAVLTWFAAVGRIDMAVLVAGNCLYVDLHDDKNQAHDPEGVGAELHFDSRIIQSMMDVNVCGVAHCIEGVLPHLHKSQGVLVGVGSASAYVPFPRAEGYGASKAAVHYLFDTLRLSLAPFGIQVNLVVPGFVKTPLTDQNNFSMPFLVDTKMASRAIRAGIARDQAEIHFPKKLTLPLKFFSHLPRFVWRAAAKNMIKNEQ